MSTSQLFTFTSHALKNEVSWKQARLYNIKATYIDISRCFYLWFASLQFFVKGFFELTLFCFCFCVFGKHVEILALLSPKTSSVYFCCIFLRITLSICQLFCFKTFPPQFADAELSCEYWVDSKLASSDSITLELFSLEILAGPLVSPEVKAVNEPSQSFTVPRELDP